MRNLFAKLRIILQRESGITDFNMMLASFCSKMSQNVMSALYKNCISPLNCKPLAGLRYKGGTTQLKTRLIFAIASTFASIITSA